MNFCPTPCQRYAAAFRRILQKRKQFGASDGEICERLRKIYQFEFASTPESYVVPVDIRRVCDCMCKAAVIRCRLYGQGISAVSDCTGRFYLNIRALEGVVAGICAEVSGSRGELRFSLLSDSLKISISGVADFEKIKKNAALANGVLLKLGGLNSGAVFLPIKHSKTAVYPPAEYLPGLFEKYSFFILFSGRD